MSELKLSATGFEILKTCPMKYALSREWESKHESAALLFGKAFHEAMDTYAKTGSETEAVRVLLDYTGVDELRSKRNLIAAFLGYLDNYRHDPLEYIEINGKPASELKFEFAVSDTLELHGVLDGIVKYHDKLFVVEYKTTGSWLSESYFKRYYNNDQALIYTMAAQVEYEVEIEGVLLDVTQISQTKRDGFRTKYERRTMYTPVYLLDEQLEALKSVSDRFLNLRRSGEAPIKNFSACSGKFGYPCDFYDYCHTDPLVRQHALETFKKRERP